MVDRNEFYSECNDTLLNLCDICALSSAGVALYEGHIFRIVTATSTRLTAVDPTEFPTMSIVDCAKEIQINLDGEQFWGGPIKNSDGNVIGCLFVLFMPKHTLTDSHKVILRLAASNIEYNYRYRMQLLASNDIHSYFATMLDNCTNMVFIKNEAFELVYGNKPFLNLYPEDVRHSVIGSTTVEKYKPEEVEIFLQDDKDAFASGYKEVIEKVAFPNGLIKTFRTVKQVMYYQSQRLLLGISEDITDRIKLENTAKQTSKDLIQVTQSALNELSNPIDKIQRTAAYLVEDNATVLDSISLQQLHEIQERAARVSEHLFSLNEFSHLESRQEAFSPVDMQLIEDSLRGILYLPSTSSLTCSSGIFELPKVSIEIVLLELVKNALQHSAQKVHGTSCLLHIDISIALDTYGFEVKVTDNGGGFSSASLASITNLFSNNEDVDFFLTHGKGLSRVKKILDSCDARFKASNVVHDKHTKDAGACIQIYWPNH